MGYYYLRDIHRAALRSLSGFHCGSETVAKHHLARRLTIRVDESMQRASRVCACIYSILFYWTNFLYVTRRYSAYIETYHFYGGFPLLAADFEATCQKVPDQVRHKLPYRHVIDVLHCVASLRNEVSFWCALLSRKPRYAGARGALLDAAIYDGLWSRVLSKFLSLTVVGDSKPGFRVLSHWFDWQVFSLQFILLAYGTMIILHNNNQWLCGLELLDRYFITAIWVY